MAGSLEDIAKIGDEAFENRRRGFGGERRRDPRSFSASRSAETDLAPSGARPGGPNPWTSSGCRAMSLEVRSGERCNLHPRRSTSGRPSVDRSGVRPRAPARSGSHTAQLQARSPGQSGRPWPPPRRRLTDPGCLRKKWCTAHQVEVEGFRSRTDFRPQSPHTKVRTRQLPRGVSERRSVRSFCLVKARNGLLASRPGCRVNFGSRTHPD